MKGFKKDGKFIPTGNKAKSSLKKSDTKRYKKSTDTDKKKAEDLKNKKEVVEEVEEPEVDDKRFEDKNGDFDEAKFDKAHADWFKIQMKENAEEHDVSIEVLDELQELEGDNVLIDDVDISSGVSGSVTKLELDNGQEWLLFADHDELKEEAMEDVKQLIDEMGVEGINGYESYLKVYDASQIAGEMADSQIEGEEDSIRSEVEGEVHDEIEEPDEDNFKNSDKYDEAYEKWEEQVEEEIESRLETAIEDKRTEIADDIEERIEEDPVGYFITEEGLYEDVKQLIDANIVSVDEDALAEYVVDSDGAEHTVSRVDGESYETKDGQILIRES